MDPTGDPVLALAERRLRWLDRRQQVLAQNIANADTPGWAARDLRPFTGALAAATGPTTTASNHMQGTRDPVLQGATLVPVIARGPNRNGVTMEEQLINVSETETAQAVAVNIFRKYMSLYRLALGRGQ